MISLRNNAKYTHLAFCFSILGSETLLEKRRRTVNGGIRDILIIMEGDQDGTDCEASAHGTQASAGNKRYRTTGCMSTQTSMPGTQTVLSGIKKISLGTQNSPASSCAIEDPENVKQLEVIGKTLVPLPQSDREPLQAFPPSASSVLLSDPRALSTASTLSRGQIGEFPLISPYSF